MSDFLTNLVVRSFARTPSFQPAMASTSFSEPSPVLASEPPVQNTNYQDTNYQNTDYTNEIQIVREEIEVPGSSPKPQIIEKSMVPPAVETPEPKVNVITLETPSPTTIQTVTPTPIVNPPSQVVPQKPVSASVPSQPPVRRRLTTHTRKAEPPIVEQHVTEQVMEHVTEQVTEQMTEHVTQHVTKQTIERPSVKRTVMIGNNQEITNSFTTLVPKPTAQPLPAVNVKKRASLPAVQPPAETEPTATLPPETVVNVAIGRIEVRATPPTAPRRERQSPGPKVMTLDDYVQQRSRGAK